MKEILDLSGFVYSGKSAVSDILREVDGFSVPASAEEFDLLRLPGGLIDLKHAVLNWSPSRSNAAFHRFERVARIAGRALPFHRKFFENGLAYQARYPDYFTVLERFLFSIVLLRWDTPWPYENLTDNPWQTVLRKMGERFGVMKLRDFCLIDREHFLERAREFTNGLLWSAVDAARFHTVVVHNSLEAFDPGHNVDLYGNAKVIVVDRDPRDIYATALVIAPGQRDKLNRYLHICAGHDIDLFIRRFNVYRSNVRESPSVLRIRFEDVVQDYERTVQSILEFLGVEASAHVRRLQCFKPEVSRKNVGMWKEGRFKRYWKDCELIGSMCNAS
jgi:Sulfotransferase family